MTVKKWIEANIPNGSKILIDQIHANHTQILASPTEKEKIPLYEDTLNYIKRLPETSGLRKKVMDIISIPDLEDTSSTSPFAS